MQLFEMEGHIKSAFKSILRIKGFAGKTSPFKVVVIPPKCNNLGKFVLDQSFFHPEPGTCWFYVTSKGMFHNMKEKKEKVDNFAGGEVTDFTMEAAAIAIPIVLGMAGVQGTELALEGASGAVHMKGGIGSPTAGMERAVQGQATKGAKKYAKKTGDRKSQDANKMDQSFIAGGPAAFSRKPGSGELVLSFRATTARNTFDICGNNAIKDGNDGRMDTEGARTEAMDIVGHMGGGHGKDQKDYQWGSYPETHGGVQATRKMAKTSIYPCRALHFVFENGGTQIRQTSDPLDNFWVENLTFKSHMKSSVNPFDK